MKCVECGAEASYWLCSNGCARMRLATSRKKQCAICSVDAKTQRLGTLETNRICRACKARPENADWLRARKEEPDELVENRVEEHERWLNEQDRPLPQLTEVYMRIAQLVIEQERVPVAYIDNKGRRRGKRYRWRAHSMRRIAEKANCTLQEVVDVIEGIEK